MSGAHQTGSDAATGSARPPLSELWRRIAAAQLHPPGCRCGGRAGGLFSPGFLESEVLEHLKTVAARRGDSPMLNLLQARSEIQAGGPSFAAWLDGLDAQAEVSTRRLIEDIRPILEAFVRTLPPPGRFTCL